MPRDKTATLHDALEVQEFFDAAPIDEMEAVERATNMHAPMAALERVIADLSGKETET